jgi:Flp pilus assembly protein TadG
MKDRFTAGVALPETAIVVGVILLLTFGLADLALMGFVQATTQGAAFVAAHNAALTTSGDQATDQTKAQSVVATPFPNIKASDVNLTYVNNNSAVQVLITKTAGGLFNPGGAALISNPVANPRVGAAAIEPFLQSPSPLPSTTPPSGVAVQGVLSNFCYPNATPNPSATPAPSPQPSWTCDQSHPVYVAQYDNNTTQGNGSNGQFAEWNCRYNLFPNSPGSTHVFPAAIPTGGPGSVWDPNPSNPNFIGASLYAFDYQVSAWGVAASC